MAKALILVSSLMYSMAYGAVVLSPEKIQLSTGMSSWLKSVKRTAFSQIMEKKYPKTGYTECRQAAEAAGIYLCVSFERLEMNAIFNRMMIHYEGGTVSGSQGKILAHDNLDCMADLFLPSGHNLKGKAIKAFFDEVAIASAGNSSFALSSAEREFHDNVYLPIKEKHPDLSKIAVIAYSVSNTYPYSTVVSHEFLHGQFAQEPGYADVVWDYWRDKNKMSEEDRNLIVAEIGKYYGDDTNVIVDEFQAYVLMAHADDVSIVNLWDNGIIARHRAPLLEALRKKGLAPIQVK